jgi:hypothetical protein
MKPGHPDVIPARVMNTILGSGFSGRLFRNLREDKAYTYGAYSSIGPDKMVGRFSATASVRNEVTDSAVTEILYELTTLGKAPVKQQELDLAKSFIAGEFARSLENPRTVAGFALNIDMYNLPEDYYETYLQKLAAVTIDDVSRVSKKYINPSKARIVVVGNKDEVMHKLSVFDKEDGKVQLYDIYANPRKDETGAAINLSPSELVEKYLGALGGRKKLEAVTSMDQTFSLELMGMALTSRVVQSDGRYYMNLSAPGTNIVKRVYDGEKGIVEEMGQQMPMEGDDLASMKEQSELFPERNYNNEGYTMEIKGIDDVDGIACYKLVVTKPSGDTNTEFYDKNTYLKVKEIQTSGSGEASSSTTFEFSDYKTVDGINIPHTVILSGAMPAPLVMKTTSVTVNTPVDPSLFKI